MAILGPTASGKSALAVHLAQQLNGEVISCDSTQLYRGFDIGTGKPTLAERQGIAHHLLDVLGPEEEATAGGYREMALAVLDDLRQRQKLPILTAGTGLYMRAVFDGIADLPQRSEGLRERLRRSMEKRGRAHLHGLLKRIDPHSAERIAPADTQKLLRAVEVCLLARRPLSEVHNEGRRPLQGWHIVKIGLNPPREELYGRIHARIDGMLAAGWVAEVRQLLSAAGEVGKRKTAKDCALRNSDTTGPAIATEGHKAYDFLGYRELAAVARGEMTLDVARAAIQQATRRYAKRQLTWFRREQGVIWFEGFGDDPAVQREIPALLSSVLSPG
jgi:tRNA dimethylallyltransferase